MIHLLWLAACAQEPPPPNLILVSLDTFRADHVSAHGYARQTTPWLDTLAEHGTVFQQAVSNSNESAYSHAVIFSGRMASEVAAPVYQEYGVPPSATLVSEILGAGGYRTAAFIAGGHVSADFGFDQGYDHFESELGFASFWHTAPKALAWLDETDDDQPWMVVLHGYDAHRPYVAPPPFFHMYARNPGSPTIERIVRDGAASEQVFGRTWYPDFDLDWFRHSSGSLVLDPDSYAVLAAGSQGASGISLKDQDIEHLHDHYDAMISYADYQLGLFFAAAEEAGKLDNTLVLITSDHGEDLLDHGFINHRTSLHESTIHVPLLLFGPGVPQGSVDTLVEARDILPTLLDAAGMERPPGLAGHSLLATARGELPSREGVGIEGVMDMLAWRTPTHKLILRELPLDSENLVDLLLTRPLDPAHSALYHLEQDPNEHQNLLETQDPAAFEKAEELRRALGAWRASLQVSTTRGPRPEDLPAETRERMQRHGYWSAEDG